MSDEVRLKRSESLLRSSAGACAASQHYPRSEVFGLDLFAYFLDQAKK
jgi:hypothetical protein